MLDAVLIHEMAHVGQGAKWYRWFRTPRYWQEGIADFVRFKLGYTNGVGCPQCSVEFPHYTSGFWCAGAFLVYLDQHYGSNLVQQLNSQICQGNYAPGLFEQTTGRN